MKKLLLIFLCCILAITFSSCSGSSNQNNNQSGLPSASSNPGIEVDKGLLDVTVNLPASLFENSNPDDVITQAKAKNITATKNEDGSYTYKMSKSTHLKFMADIKKNTEEGMIKIKTDEIYKEVINDIKYNNDFTKIILIVNKSNYQTGLNSMVTFGIGLQAMMYQTMNGTPENKISIDIRDMNTGETFNTIVYPDAINKQNN